MGPALKQFVVSFSSLGSFSVPWDWAVWPDVDKIPSLQESV
jgi:hypothetical protein